MRKTRISDNWYFKNITDNTDYEIVDLPHDYQISAERDPSLTFSTGYYPDKSGKYIKYLQLSKGTHYILDVDGA